MKLDLAVKHGPGNWEFLELAINPSFAMARKNELEKQGLHVGLFRSTKSLGKMVYQTADCQEPFRNGPDTNF